MTVIGSTAVFQPARSAARNSACWVVPGRIPSGGGVRSVGGVVPAAATTVAVGPSST